VVGVASQEAPEVALVAPSQPEASYLLLKLQGRQAAVGGTGSQMPPDGDLLSDEELAAVEAWILDGAPND
jgi:mono/diheme cytochrome c family protein